MRWFVEVSRVGESGLSEKYCVEAKQWQAALQEARKLRGDTGALSKFSIELLDDGYRAVDPSLKLRYLVNKAPSDAPLTPLAEDTEFNSLQSNGKSGKHLAAAAVGPTSLKSIAPKSIAPKSIAPKSITPKSITPKSITPESLSKPSPSGIPRPTSQAPRPNASAPPRPTSNAPPRMLLVPDDPVPPAPRAPIGLSAELEPAPAIALLPAFEIVRERGEEPRAESPITYREVAYAVKPGTSREQIEALLWARYSEVASAIEERPAGKFVQLAVFDHVFQKRPDRPPLATFAWKDWRGSPVLAFPGFGEAAAGPISQVPPSEVLVTLPPTPAPVSALAAPVSAPPPVVSFPPLAIAATAAAVPGALSAPGSGSMPAAAPPVATLVVVESAPVPPVAPVPVAPVAAAAAAVVVEPAAAVVVESMPAPVVVEPMPAPAVPEAIPAPVVPAPALELNFDAAPRKSSPDADRQSRPRMAVAGRRRAGEDLISELFELMHELHFMRDVAAGAEFVLSVLDEVLPCEGVLIHVFDINTNHFVVVRAKGPNAKGALLQRMPDQDPLALSVMRSPQAISIKNAQGDPRFAGARWATVGVVPKMALCAPVRQGGRYLGLIELVNPAGDAPFHSSELNALDYVCEQFAEFLSKKPIILAADVVLART